ncbi:MAG: hypothetical protein JSU70_10615 [Phycisphaerales bacterium]|nr:MAG: hypothetical protein JSU70_10615 [Phycisphaerales bacterium]
MKLKGYIKYIGVVAFFGGVCGLAACLARLSGQDSQAAAWYSIVPAVLAIVLAFLTHHVLLSLGIAIVVGGLLSSVPPAPLSAAAWLGGLKSAALFVGAAASDRTNLLILSFIPPIFVMVEVTIASGGFHGIILWLLKRVKNRKSAQAATALLGILCFIDDYANAIIVGSMMQPITDRFRVSREKLSFIVDATSAPISGLAVVSTWIAYEVGLFADMSQKLGMGKTGYSMFFDALSFRFYCLLMIVFVFVHIILGRDFGPMKSAEDNAKSEGTNHDNETDSSAHAGSPTGPADGQVSGRAINALLPLGGLILFHMTGLWIDGSGPARLAEGGSPLSWVYWREVISDAEHSHHMLLFSALFGMTIALLCGRLSGALRLSTVRRCFYRGIKRAAMPSVILILAWSLKNCCDSLKAGEFLTTMLADRVSPHWFPPILFLVASVTSFATGTSWGTMAILIPTAIPVAFALDGQTYGLTTMISLGAVLDGAIFGDHCSPISDTTIISSTASSCDLMRHVRTQLPYSLSVAALALLGAYLPSAFGLAPRWSLTLAVLIMLSLFAGYSWYRRRRVP